MVLKSAIWIKVVTGQFNRGGTKDAMDLKSAIWIKLRHDNLTEEGHQCNQLKTAMWIKVPTQGFKRGGTTSTMFVSITVWP